MNSDDKVPAKIKAALHKAAEIACGNVPELPGPVVIGLDTSGSMGCSVTGFRAGRNGTGGATSKMRCVDIAALFASANSEDELMAIHDKATQLGLEVHLITDSGRTEFHGQPTRTCLAIGPDECNKVDQVTGHLELL